MSQGKGDGSRKPYTAPTLRHVTDQHEVLRALNRAIERAELAERRAFRWKEAARKIWRSKVYKTGRYGCAAIDVRLRRNGFLPQHEGKSSK